MPAVKIEVIINAGSGSDDKQDLRRRLEEMFGASNINARVSLARTGAEVVELARQAAQNDAQIIVAGGGDGTINAVAAAVIDSNKTLGILPLGTMNHLAKDLGLPLDVEGAVKTIIEGEVVHIDVGKVNDHIFLNNSSLGLYPNIVREREKHQDRKSVV